MDSVDIEKLLEDPTSTDGSVYGSVDVQEIYRQVSQHDYQAATMDLGKRAQNAYYGKSVMQSREEQHFQNAVEEISNSPNGLKIDAREVRGLRDMFLNALQHIEEHHYSTDGYKWFLHMETMELVRDLFEDHFISSGMTTGINPDSYAIHGVPFLMTSGIPKGRIILADEEFVKRDPIRPHTMVLIDNATDGYPSDIPLSVGGEMEIYTIQK